MAPKKDKGKITKKATKASKAKEAYKKDKDEAQAIVTKLKRMSRQPTRFQDNDVVLNETVISSKMVHSMTTDPESMIIPMGSKKGKAKDKDKITKKATRASQSKQVYKKKENEANAIAAKLKRLSKQPVQLQDLVSKATVNQSEMFNSTVTVNPTKMVNSNAVFSTVTAIVSSLTDDSTEVGTLTAERNFVYEIDCENVAGSVNVADLQKFLQEHLKLDGKKNNCGDVVAICCRGAKVEISSKKFQPKRYMKFLCKKFLKRKRYIRVVAKDKGSYEFQYCGVPE